MPAIVKTTKSYRAWRINAADTNYMIGIVDPVADGDDGITFTAIIEVYAKGGRTPPNTHRIAAELFFVLEGKGIAYFDDKELPIGKGDAITILPGTEHVVANTGDGKLYTLTIMVPNEEFAELIHNGTLVELDAEDRRVIGGVY